ncbi:chemotaxis protein CheB [Paraburkholderia sp. BCC1876]|uniref:chemotaxis protein CheB n=1 Tax=Paraburkholderia sp. BCC1876 TaxID=2676303 RepID=UPI001591CA3C|nr:chemotaxis protein CheB [Paraburkholderia sp. BCC1876]
MPESLSHRPDKLPARTSAQGHPGSDSTSKAEDFPVVGIGASAGGLEACRKLLGALPVNAGMAFVLVQHLDPTHKSMMVDLLGEHASVNVREAEDGMLIEREYLYVIPPGASLSVRNGTLQLSKPLARHGARLPFDFLLRSMAEEYGARAICVILSGMGADGSLGLKAIREAGGLVIAQDPNEAAYDSMPQSAIATGGVDLVLLANAIPAALAEFQRRMALPLKDSAAGAEEATSAQLSKIVELLRVKTTHDFTFYKPGTLVRRIRRRMALVALDTGDISQYLEVLQRDSEELDRLAADLLINVTRFFRDTSVFEFLEKTTVPELVQNRAAGQSLRIWVAGCSSGEEVYSLAMVFREQIVLSGIDIKLQVFASDIAPHAVARAREGLYAKSIEADVSPGRLARFFSREEHQYRVLPELRSVVVFTVQDVLADPPFSRLDLVSCRNLLIYLMPEAQAKVIALFHFALREGGILLLGSAETAGNTSGRFELVSKAERVYRHIGHSRPGDLGFLAGTGELSRLPLRNGQAAAVRPRHAAMADLCRQLVMDAFAPAAVLTDRNRECLFFLGATDRYLHVPRGAPTRDLLSMAPDAMRTRLRLATEQASRDGTRVVVKGGGSVLRDGKQVSFNIDVLPVTNGGEALLLVCFVDLPEHAPSHTNPVAAADTSRVEELGRELETTRDELHRAIHSLELAGEEQKTINEEALSVNEEYQSTNEELVTSKEELQSLNEELTALNGQLQETLERQRITYNDLQNVLFSTDVATLFLDRDLNIRFFTPATKLVFSVIPGDVGRPLADLRSLAADADLLTDAQTVLQTGTPIEREIEARSGVWLVRRILPYHTNDNGIEGVVITFTDITDRKHTTKALEAARQQADQANVAKSRFLAAASHDLRQPLQTLTLLHSLLAKHVEGDMAGSIVARFEQTLDAMSGMLNTLLDINQIEAGTVHAEISSFPLNTLFDRLRDEFAFHAQAQGLSLHVVPCHLSIQSDSRLLDQIIRNLLSNALKYTQRGKVLLGCRRRNGVVSIEVWDTGIGIPAAELKSIFDEYHQLNNAARERRLGLGLGLSISQRLARLLKHRIRVRSEPGKGSVFTIDVGGAVEERTSVAIPLPTKVADETVDAAHRTGAILVIEDDPEVRSLLELILTDEGHRAAAARDGIAALEWVTRDTFRPDLILADYNLPNGMNGLEVATKLRETLRRQIPTIILTGDISTETLKAIALKQCAQLNKPVQVNTLSQLIQHLLPELPPTPLPHQDNMHGKGGTDPVIYVVDDDSTVRDAIRAVLEEDGQSVETYPTCEAFLSAYHSGREACLLVDGYLPGMSGLELLEHIRETKRPLPAIMITGHSDVSMVVRAMKAGAADFIEKPIGRTELLDGIRRAFEQSRDSNKLFAWRETAAQHIATLTPRQHEIMNRVLAGQPSKIIASDLSISQRTVENHRAAIMTKTGAGSLPALARMALAAASYNAEPSAASDESAATA